MDKNRLFQDGIRDGIPIALGYLAVSFTFGMMAVDGGLTVGQAILISALNLTSAGQFAGLDIILTGGTMLEMILTQLVINLRYSLMSFSLTQKLDPSVKLPQRLLISYGVTDEIFGVTSVRKGKVQFPYSCGVLITAVPGWVAGTALGAAAGSVMPPFLMSALSVAIYGMFLAIIIPPAKANRAVLLVVLCSMGISALFRFTPVLNRVTTGFVIIFTAVLVSAVAAKLCPVREEAS